jgi:hypothetical protein
MSQRLGLAAALLALATPAAADVVHWKDVSGWDISFYSSDQGCSAYTVFEGGISFYLGLATDADTIYLSIYMTSPDWHSIEDGKSYDVAVQFGRRAPWNLDMAGHADQNGTSLTFMHDATEDDAQRFVNEFMRETRMEWSYLGNSLGVLSLRGSSRAFQEAIACTESYLQATGAADPFASGATDPFK